MRRVEHGLAVALAEVPGPRFLEHRRHVRTPSRPEDPLDLCEVGVLVGNVLHDHRRDHGVERAVGDLRHRVGRSDERVGSTGTVPKRARAARPRGRPRTRAATTSMRPSRESAAKSGPSPQPRSASASGPAGSERVRSVGSSLDVEVDRGFGVPLAHASEVTRRPGRQSPVSPSQQPTLNRQRGHWNVPCRHSMCAPQRMQISTISRHGLCGHALHLRASRRTATMARPGAVAEWLGRGLQSLVQRFESARRLSVLIDGS